MNLVLKYGVAVTLCFTPLLLGKPASAKPPASIAGTWTGVANRNAVTLRLTQDAFNPAQDSNCRFLRGSINVTGETEDQIQGFYCPQTGAFAFSRIRSDGYASQVYRGGLSSAGTPLRMGGTFLYMSGNWGEYNFSATK